MPRVRMNGKERALQTPPNALSAPEIAPVERRWLAGLLLLLLGVRVWFAWKIDFNSDETQHLHVVWAWANHLWPYSAAVGDRTLPYRDVFDNHTPLFHLLCAPLFRLFGETAQVMIYMRLAMIPLFAVTLWLVVKIGTALFSPRAGWWAAVLAGFFPLLFLKTVEFRTDVLWVTAWLAVMAIATGGPLTARRLGVLGLALGAAFAVSMKTVLLALALLLAGLVVLVLWWRHGGVWRGAKVLAGTAAGLAGLVAVPGLIAAYFAAQHALYAAPDPVGTLYYGVIGHNLVPHHAEPGTSVASRLFWFPLTLPLLIAAAVWTFRRAAQSAQGLRRVLVLLVAASFLALLHSYWPMITSQDYLPVAPLLIVLATPAVLALRPAGWPRLALPLAVVALEVAVTFKFAKLRESSAVAQLAEILRFTDPGDYVMDAKSGAIFRRRPFFYVLESVTGRRMKSGLIADDIVARMVATHTCVASDKHLTGRVLEFVLTNYLPTTGRHRIAGQYLQPDAGGRAIFDLPIQASYVLVAPRGAVAGRLDGKPYAGKVLLDAGRHEFVSDSPSGALGIVWSQAVERGFQPNFSTSPENAESNPENP